MANYRQGSIRTRYVLRKQQPNLVLLRVFEELADIVASQDTSLLAH